MIFFISPEFIFLDYLENNNYYYNQFQNNEFLFMEIDIQMHLYVTILYWNRFVWFILNLIQLVGDKWKKFSCEWAYGGLERALNNDQVQNQFHLVSNSRFCCPYLNNKYPLRWIAEGHLSSVTLDCIIEPFLCIFVKVLPFIYT